MQLLGTELSSLEELKVSFNLKIVKGQSHSREL